MKRSVIVLSIFLTMIFGVYAQSSDVNGFKGLIWGSSKADIIKKEGKPEEIFQDCLFYNGYIANKKAVIIYELEDDKLTSGMYGFKIEHVNKNLYIEDFEDLKKQLIKKYGKPSSDDINWSNDLYKDDPSDWGRAISYGYLEYVTIWDFDKTKIILGLKGDNYKINLGLLYVSKEHIKTVSESVDENL